jgi:hypothetical protein
MRRIFGKSRCKCPRCVAKRRLQFLALFGSCIVAAAGCYLLVHHSDPGAPSTLNQQEALAEQPIPDVNVILGRKAQPLSIAATQLGAVWKEQDNKNVKDSLPKESVSANSREQRESLTLPESNRDLSENRFSNFVEELPMPHASGWQTVVPSEAPKSPPKVDHQREPQPDEKVAATPAQSSPESANGELQIHPSGELGVNKNSAEPVEADLSNPDGLLSRWLTKNRSTVQGKSEETSLDGSELLAQNQENATRDPVSEAPAIATTPGTDSKSNASKSDKPEQGTNRAPEVAESELPGEQPAVGAADLQGKEDPEDVAMAETSGLDKPFEPQSKEPDSAIRPEPENSELPIHVSPEPGANRNSGEAVQASPSDPHGLLSQWLTESRSTVQGKSVETSLDGNELLVQNQEVAESEMPRKQPEPPSSETSDVATPSSVAQSIADPSFAGPVVVATTNVSPANVSPALSNRHVVRDGAAELREKKNPEDVAMAKTSGPAVALVASLGNNPSGEVPAQEPRKPRGYITIKSEPEEAQNQEAEDRPPKPRDHPLKTQNHPSNVEDYPSKALGHSQKPQDQPPNVRDYFANTQDRPSKPPDTSGDLRRFASSFVQSDQSGNIADQHRFFADSVHYYHEGDLSWAGVAAATRRYHQGNQNRRYGAEGTATVKGPVNGGFYVVEQPVSWSRSEGSRVTRGRSVLRLRVVPTDRNGWKITSIEEIGQQ